MVRSSYRACLRAHVLTAGDCPCKCKTLLGMLCSFELALLVCNQEGVLHCALGANEQLYLPATVDRMSRHFRV